MNTLRSVGYGWGVLIVAGAGSYYFAKRSVNADRAERAEAEEKRRQQRDRLRRQEHLSREKVDHVDKREPGAPGVTSHDSMSPSKEASGDPAPVKHSQEQMAGRGAYEAAEPFRSRKGDRFS